MIDGVERITLLRMLTMDEPDGCSMTKLARGNDMAPAGEFEVGLDSMFGKATLAMAAALLVSGAGFAASADPAKVSGQNNFSGDVDPTGPWTLKPDHKTLQFGGGGRWGLKLDMEQPLGRDMGWKDVKAGAYIRLTPNIRVGGTVGLGDRLAQPQKVTPQDAAPRVHLETAFKF